MIYWQIKILGEFSIFFALTLVFVVRRSGLIISELLQALNSSMDFGRTV